MDRLTAHYGPVVAVREVSLHVGEGEIVALLGANGAGKTTTLASIAGLHPARSGRIGFEGRDLSRLSPERVLRRGISLTPEGRRLFSTLTVEENLLLGGATRGRGARRDYGELLELCDRAYVMRVGRIEAEGTPDELRRSHEVRAAYMGVA